MDLVLRSGWADGAGSVGRRALARVIRMTPINVELVRWRVPMGIVNVGGGVMLVIDRVAMMLRGQVLVLVMGWVRVRVLELLVLMNSSGSRSHRS